VKEWLLISLSIENRRDVEANPDERIVIACIAKALVDSIETVVATEIQRTRSSVIELKVAKEDVGKIIGKRGRAVVALRTILNAASMKLKKRCILDLLDQKPSIPS
jgi:predicted RNA-binding protein YlqC (UPF0109 family)